MTTYRFANNASTTLGSGISPTATTITVATSTGTQFPALAAGQYFTATLIASGSSTGTPNEIVRVTARVGDTMTVVRGQEGTTAQAWDVGDAFENFVTAGFLNQLVDTGSLQAQTGNYAIDSGTANVGVITLTPAPANFAALIGVPLRVKKGGATSTGAYTLNVNALGNVSVLIGGQPLEGAELVASEIFEVIYDGTQFNLISNPGVLHGDRLAANSVANASLTAMSAGTLKGNVTGSPATPYDVPLSALMEALGFGPNSLTTPGYYILPNIVDPSQPFIVQWGELVYTTPANISITWPIPFPNAFLWFNPGMRQTLRSGNQNNVTIESEVGTLTGWSAYSDASGNNDPIRLSWLSLGR